MPRWDLPRHEQSIWDGTPLDGRRVLIRCYHGLGDTIQFARSIPLVERVASEVTVWAQPSLIPLLETMHTRARFLPLHDGTPDVEYDVDVEIMELAYVFRVTPETIPQPPYLHVAPGDVRGGIGVAWRAGDGDPQRSVPRELFDGVSFHSLDRDNPEADTPLNGASDARPRPGHHGRYDDVASRRRAGRSDVDAAAAKLRLALDGRPRGHAVVSHHAPVPVR